MKLLTKNMATAVAIAFLLKKDNYSASAQKRGGGNEEETTIIHNLLSNRTAINREYNNTEGGIESYTWSDDPEVSNWIKQHVNQMKSLVESNNGKIRQWDDLFVKMFELRDYHRMEVRETDDGVKVEQTGDNECAKALVQAHAKVVSNFIKLGQQETSKNHAVPDICEATNGSANSKRRILSFALPFVVLLTIMSF